MAGCVTSKPAAPPLSERMYYDAYAVLQAKDYPETITLLTQLISLDARFTDAYILRAFAFEQESQLDPALQDLLTAQALEPNNFVIHYNLGNIYYRLKAPAKAVEQFTLSLSIKRDHANSYLNRATAYLALREWGKASADFKIYVSLSPNQKETIQRVITLLDSMAAGK